MAYSLATSGGNQHKSVIKRFDPRFWTVNFPRPMMAAVTSTGPQSLRATCVFYHRDELAGLIWEAEDVHDHPLLAYETARDFSGCQLSFDWQSSGIMPLDAVNGPTLTIEGRDASGAARSWFVRLWNYAVGTPTNARITLDFGALQSGFLWPQEAAVVYPGDIDRMFISLVPPGYSGVAQPLPAPVEAWVALSSIKCDGPGSVLSIGDVMVPPHTLAIASGYDDSYNLTPARLLRTIVQLGYRADILHYVGMSHYFRLEPSGGGLYASLSGGAINTPCATWHADFAARSQAAGYSLIVSLSYELFDAHCWQDWKQRCYNGDPALTGYTPPSTLLSPANVSAMAYLQAVARAFVFIATSAGHRPRFQVGEPWWWVMPDGRICLYDAAARAALGGAPVEIASITVAGLTLAQKALLDSAGALLAASTAALVAAVRTDRPDTQSLILVYLPTVLDQAAPEAARANVPLGWASPAFDVLQLEDYDWVTTGNSGASARGAAAMTTRLGYPVAAQHYLSGFVQARTDAAQWELIDTAASVAVQRGVAQTFIWALPQVMRDGFTHFSSGEHAVNDFDDVIFPLSLGLKASVSPGFSTAIVTSASGIEQRNSDWASARLRYDAGPGVRSQADMETLISFFRARRGAAKAFRFRDPFDYRVLNQILGSGDGVRTSFALVKTYGTGDDAEIRPITHPVAGTVIVRIAGSPVAGWTLGAGGTVLFAVPPLVGATISASFDFDVPVRFETDSLTIESDAFLAGEAASVPLVEVRTR